MAATRRSERRQAALHVVATLRDVLALRFPKCRWSITAKSNVDGLQTVKVRWIDGPTRPLVARVALETRDALVGVVPGIGAVGMIFDREYSERFIQRVCASVTYHLGDHIARRPRVVEGERGRLVLFAEDANEPVWAGGPDMAFMLSVVAEDHSLLVQGREYFGGPLA